MIGILQWYRSQRPVSWKHRIMVWIRGIIGPCLMWGKRRLIGIAAIGSKFNTIQESLIIRAEYATTSTRYAVTSLNVHAWLTFEIGSVSSSPSTRFQGRNFRNITWHPKALRVQALVRPSYFIIVIGQIDGIPLNGIIEDQPSEPFHSWYPDISQVSPPKWNSRC